MNVSHGSLAARAATLSLIVVSLLATSWASAHGRRNHRPIADAGADQAAFVGQTVTLDGSASRDPDGDELKYVWEMVRRPKHSKARLHKRRTVMPTLLPDVPGRYVIALVVHDCKVPSKPDFVVVQVGGGNVAPVANAGPDQAAFVGDTVQLDGSASSDANGDALTFRWSVPTAPAGSQARPSDANAVRPTLVPDLVGDYVVSLVVNDGRADSAPSSMTIRTASGNNPPVANAGLDQSSRVGLTVFLDAGASSDPDGDPLSFEWSFVSRPDGSGAVLQGAGTQQPSFMIDLEGQYVLELRACDPSVCSAPDAVVVSAAGNSVPVANAGAPQTVRTGATVNLDGNGSSDADGDPLSFEWSLTAVPAGSGASLDQPSSPTPRFTADVAGDYVAQLIVNDGRAASAPATVLITVLNAPPTAVDDSAQTFAGEPVTINVLANDSDADGDTLTIASVTQPASGGTVAINGASVVFTPAAGFTGTSSFGYTVSDGVDSSVANVDVQVRPLPTLSISDASVVEGNSGSRIITFAVTLSEPFVRTVTASFNTTSGTAIGGTDYIALRSSVSFATGETSRPINISVLGDTLVEADETFRVNLTGSTGGPTIADAQGIGTIVNDD